MVNRRFVGPETISSLPISQSLRLVECIEEPVNTSCGNPHLGIRDAYARIVPFGKFSLID